MIFHRSHRLHVTTAAAVALLAITGCNRTGSPIDETVDGRDSMELLRAGASTHASGDPVSAISLYQQALVTSPFDPLLLLALAEALADSGDHEGAIVAYEKAINAGADDSDKLRGIGNSLTTINRPELALPKLQRSVMAAPNPAGYNSLGVAYDALGRAEDAQEAYQEGLSMDPGHIGLANNLALSLALSGFTGDAIEILEELVMEPGSTSTQRQNLALSFGLAGDYERASEIGREDLDELAVVRNISYYRILAAMDDHASKVSVVGVMRNNTIADAIATANLHSTD
jgi:Flp pilus assembly protein TadD